MTMHKSFLTLGLEEPSSSEEIEQAFKFLSLAFHPDRFPEKWRPLANEKMIAIVAAREALRNYTNQPSPQASQNQQQNAGAEEKAPEGETWKPAFAAGMQLCNGRQCRELFIQPDEPVILKDNGAYYHPWCFYQ